VNERELLKSVSRSFYISIRLLPKALREPVALGYLLARTSDTIADGTAVDVEKRIELLDRFARAIAGKDQAIGDDLTQLCGSPGMTDGENALLGSADEICSHCKIFRPKINVISVSCLQSSHVGNGRI
jgi:phytoene/squalene synthetase